MPQHGSVPIILPQETRAMRTGFEQKPSKAHVWRVFPGQRRPKCEQCDLVWEAGKGKPKGKCTNSK